VPEFVKQFMLRVQDVIDTYNPDLLYLTTTRSLTSTTAAISI